MAVSLSLPAVASAMIVTLACRADMLFGGILILSFLSLQYLDQSFLITWNKRDNHQDFDKPPCICRQASTGFDQRQIYVDQCNCL